MPNYSLHFQKQIQASPATVYEHLRNPHNFIGLQPLLTHVENVQFSEENGKSSVSYDTVEAFRWLGIALYRNRIHVQGFFTNPPHKLETVVHSFPNIVLNVEYFLKANDGGTLLEETMNIQVATWLSKFVLTQATNAQTATLENLKTRLEKPN